MLVKRAVSYSLSKTRLVLPSLIIFLAATQLGLHFWPPSSLVYGVRIDYLSPTLYVLDILILLYLLLQKEHQSKSLYLVLLVLIPNLRFSINALSTLSWSFHFFLYLAFVNLLFRDPHPVFLAKGLVVASLFQLILSASQVYLGHSVQGFLYYFGERMVSVGQPGVALGSLMGRVVLRAYGTFGHPNVLAGWLVLVYLILRKLTSNGVVRYWLLTLPMLGIFLTQSRSAALALFGIIIPLYVLKSFRVRALYYFIFSALVLFYASSTISKGPDLSLTERVDLQKLSLQVIQRYPLFGTGASASISSYPGVVSSFRLLQPDHNSATLFLSWFGIMGVYAMVVLVHSTVSRWPSAIMSVIPILPLILLDHYLITSPQGLFIFLIYLKVVNYSHVKSHRQ